MPDDWPAFNHVGTHVYDHLDAEGRCFGNTVWIGSINGQTTGAAWEWTEFRHGVVVMTDPNTIVSNLQIRSAIGLSDSAGLNHIAHSLPWQEAVCRVIKAMRDYPAASPATRVAPARRLGRPSARLHAAAVPA